jgi:hypothetical protein
VVDVDVVVVVEVLLVLSLVAVASGALVEVSLCVVVVVDFCSLSLLQPVASTKSEALRKSWVISLRVIYILHSRQVMMVSARFSGGPPLDLHPQNRARSTNYLKQGVWWVLV